MKVEVFQLKVGIPPLTSSSVAADAQMQSIKVIDGAFLRRRRCPSPGDILSTAGLLAIFLKASTETVSV